MKKLFTAFFFLIILNLAGLAQKGFDPGYIVTNQFDTLRGFIKLQPDNLNSTSCIFMQAGDPAPRTYSPQDLKSYRIENKKYYVMKEVLVDSVKKTLFLEYLVHGIADLYYLKEQAREYYFLDKGGLMTPLNNNGKTISRIENEGRVDEKMVTYYQPSLQYKRMMTVLFQDSPEILKKIPDLNYNYRSLINITVDYHNAVCKDHACIDYTKSTNQHIFLEPWAGYRLEWMGLAKSKDLTNSNSFGAGIFLRFKPFKGYSNWDLLFGLGYSSSTFTGNYRTTLYAISDPNYVSTYLLKASYNEIMLPIGAEYTFPVKKVKPFFSLELLNAYLLNPQSSSQKISSGSTLEKGHFRSYQVGGIAEAGFKVQTGTRSYIILRNSLTFRRSAASFAWIFDKTHIYSYSLSLGYGFILK